VADIARPVTAATAAVTARVTYTLRIGLPTTTVPRVSAPSSAGASCGAYGAAVFFLAGHRAKSEGGEHGDKKCGAVEPEIGHPIPAGYAAGGEHRGEASGSIVQLRVREIATRLSDYDNVGPIACIYVECRCRVDINGGTGVRRMRCDHHVSNGPSLSVSLVVAASRGGSEHGLTLNPIDRLAQRLYRHAAHVGIGAVRTRRSLKEGVGHRVVETQ
jgi:hypothetical protein